MKKVNLKETKSISENTEVVNEVEQPVRDIKKKYEGYRPNYFKLYELLPKELYVDEDTGWEMFDEKLLRTIDIIREIVGVPLICNNWHDGGSRNYCGARTPKSKHYNHGSFHSVRDDRPVMAADLISTRMSAPVIRQTVASRHAELPYPIRFEEGVSWVHVDTNAKVGYKVYFFNP